MTPMIREPEVKRLLGISGSTIRRLEKHEGFPKRQRISKRCIGWPQEAVIAWMQAKLGEYQNDN